VLLVGCGALGSVVAEILARAGVARLTLADRDYIDESNLQRQSLYTEDDCRQGLPKAVAAARHLTEINSGVDLIPQVLDVNARSIESLVRNHDLIVDGTDNFETRYLLNDASLKWNALPALRSGTAPRPGEFTYLRHCRGYRSHRAPGGIARDG
jgi:molybdopterin/thiamine biosynthesis adenylyltransferase